MKALSLWQPWATLVALGKKRIETRSWGTDYRGPLAIHATKTIRKECLVVMKRRVFVDALHMDPDDLPLGVIVAIVDLVGCEQIMPWSELPPSPEFDFGNYTAGRFMWSLADVQELDEPVPARGLQGLWEWQWPVLEQGGRKK